MGDSLAGRRYRLLLLSCIAEEYGEADQRPGPFGERGVRDALVQLLIVSEGLFDYRHCLLPPSRRAEQVGEVAQRLAQGGEMDAGRGVSELPVVGDGLADRFQRLLPLPRLGEVQGEVIQRSGQAGQRIRVVAGLSPESVDGQGCDICREGPQPDREVGREHPGGCEGAAGRAAGGHRDSDGGE